MGRCDLECPSGSAPSVSAQRRHTARPDSDRASPPPNAEEHASADERGTHRSPGAAARRVDARRRRGANRAAARDGQADRARAPRPPARPGLVRRARRVRHVHRPTDFAGRQQQFLGDGVVTGHGTDRRPAGLRLQPGLHGLRRLAVRGVRREDLQGHGPRDEGRRADHRPQRFRRRANPGRRASRSAATPTSSCATSWRPASSRRSPSSWARAPAARSTRRRSPTSRSWSRGRATCSSPGRTS